jgi:glycosyltransferase involved in cell wall biosynthesis
VIVVDVGSTDGTADAVERAPLQVRLVRGGGEGPAAARMRGASFATGRLLAFTDADCEPAPGWLAAAAAAARDADLVQGRVLPPPGAVVGPFDRHITVTSEYGLYETANLIVGRELFERLGGFESILVPRGGKELGEDVWLGWRARRAGARTAFCADALVHHAVFPRGPAGYVAERARLRFFPELARRVPELRETFFHRRVFLNRRSALFDLAIAGGAVAAARRSPLWLALAVPYAREVRRSAAPWRGQRAKVAAAGVAADGVGAAAMAYGSLASRSLLI